MIIVYLIVIVFDILSCEYKEKFQHLYYGVKYPQIRQRTLRYFQKIKYQSVL